MYRCPKGCRITRAVRTVYMTRSDMVYAALDDKDGDHPTSTRKGPDAYEGEDGAECPKCGEMLVWAGDNEEEEDEEAT